ncbi:MAG TPA: MFS transporter, partial [Actinomycetota bacterium]|nr:MFS transporter [Actinomycetota bacterium]
MSSEPAARGGSVTTRERVREVFAQRGFRRLIGTRVVSQMGDGIFQLSAAAVLLFENAGPNPVFDLLAVSIVTLVPFSVIAPFTGVFIDRWDRHKILTRVPLIRAAIAAMLPLAALTGEGGPAFYAVVLLVLSANRFFLATMSAILPQLVPADDLLVANSAATTGGAIANVTGQGVGSALAAAIGGVRSSLLASLLFAAAALAARRVPAACGEGRCGEQ